MDRIEADIWSAKDVARLLALVENEKRYYQEILTRFPVAAAVIGRDLSLLSINREFRRCFLTNHDQEQDRLRRLTDVLHATVIREQVVPAFDSAKALQGAEITVVNDKGVASPWLLDTLPLPDVHSDSPQEALVVLRPMVERDGALASLLERAGAIIWKLDPASGELEFGNEGASRALGFQSPAEWINRVHPEDERRVAWVYEAVIEAAREATVEYRVVRPHARKGENPLWAADQLLPVKDSSGSVAALHVITSLQSERRAQLAESLQTREMAASMRLARQLAHEFNNLWMIVGGYAEVMESRFGDDAEARSSLDEISKAAQRGIDTTRQLLEFARPASVATHPVDLHKELREWNLDADLALPPGVAPVSTDPPRLRAAIEKLIEFAKARTVGSPRLNITTHRETLLSDYGGGATRGRYVVLHVGPVTRLQASTVQHWCEPYFSETEKVAPIGLAPVYSQLRQMAVAVRLEPTGEGIGAFLLYLPLARLPEPAKPKSVPPAAVPPFDAEPGPIVPSKETVLVVDEDESIRSLIARILERDGYRVLVGANGEEALAVGRQANSQGEVVPALLIADVTMEGMSGPELASLLSESIPSLRVLFVSGFAEDPELIAGELPAGEGFLQKPFTIAALTGMVRTVLDTPRN